MPRTPRSCRQPRRVVGQPWAGSAFHDGVGQMVGAVRPTLGPLPKMVAIAPVIGQRPPELLDDGGVIVRRITDLPDRDADMGAMFVRSMLWRLHNDVGDGTATAAVLFESVYEAGRRYLASGGNAMRLRQFLQQGLSVILDHIQTVAKPANSRQLLTCVAETAGADRALAMMLGEIFDNVGEWGTVEIRSGHGRTLERAYIEGMQWDGGVLSSHLLTDATAREARIEDAAVLVSDFAITDPAELVPLMDLIAQHQVRSLLISSRSISDRAIAFLVVNQKPGNPRVVVVRAPGAGMSSHHELEDLSMLVGGRPLVAAAGDSLSHIKIEDLGGARRAWANLDYAGVAGGRGDPRALRRHIISLKATMKAASTMEERAGFERRIGRLVGGLAILQVRGATGSEIKHRKSVAERTARTIRGAIRDGVVPGGGSTLISCRHDLTEQLARCEDADERAAYRMLLDAVSAPMRAIAANAGLDPSATMARIEGPGCDHGRDARDGSVVDMYEAGIVDSAAVQLAATRAAVSSAALALTIDVLVHSKHPEEVLEP